MNRKVAGTAHTRFKLELAAEDVHQELDDGVHRGQGVREQDEPDHDGLLLDKSERLVQRLVVDEDREQRKDVEHVELNWRVSGFCVDGDEDIVTVELSQPYLRNTEELRGVAQTPVAQLVAQHSDNLLWLALLDQSIVEDDVLLPRQTIEVGIAVSTALAAVNDMQLLEREVKSLGKLLDTSLERTRFERRELVEQRQDHNRVNGDGEHLNEHAEEPQIVEERVAGFLDDLENSANDGCSQNNSQELTLEHIRDPELERLLVEPEFFLQDKMLVVRNGKRENGTDDVEAEEEHECLRDFALEPTGEIPRKQETADAPELGQDIAVDEREILDLTIQTRNETELGLGATVCLYVLEAVSVHRVF